MANEYLIKKETLTSIADAIREKTGLSDSMSPASFANTIGLIETGGGSGGGSPSVGVTSKDVNFIDYDGTLLYSYTVAEAQALTELPPLPSHDGLICQGWNYDLATIKSYNRDVTIGAMYITDDGKTRIYISLQDGRTSPMLGCCPDGTVTVDWGDGSAPDTLTGTSVYTVKWTSNHQYANPGDYVITLTVDGSIGFYSASSTNARSGVLRFSSGSEVRNRVYQNSVTKIEIGNGVTSISDYAFSDCYSLNSITIPDSVTSIGNYVFRECYSLSSITIPEGVTSISTSVFYNCYSLNSITIPDGVTSIGSNTFQGCYSLSSITIPDSVTSISTSAFNNCYSLSSITIPDGVTSIGSNTFQGCYSLNSITIPDGVMSIGSTTFNNCYSLSSITIPDSVTSISEQAFYNCYSLDSITIPEGVTSISDHVFYKCYSLNSITIPDSVTSIGNYVFRECYSLSSITFPESVTSIGTYAFQSCYGIRYCDFSRHTSVPTLSATNAFNNVPNDCEIRVPAALADEWKAATNWSTYASQIVGV